MYILGINTFHVDAAVCLLRDGKLVAAIAEERLGRRRKHFAGFPAQAVRRVLDIAGIGMCDVDYVGVGHNPRANATVKAAYALANPRRSLRSAVTFLSRQRQIESLADLIGEECNLPPESCRFQLVKVEHHIAHLASTFYCSEFAEAAGFSYDASGDFVSTIFAHCTGQTIHPRERIFLPHSLGYFYTAICQFIGFDQFAEEYKVMGLAAYGEAKYLGLMERMVMPVDGGKFKLDQRYFSGLLQRSQSLFRYRGQRQI